MLKKYIAREPDLDVVQTSNRDDATRTVAGLFYQDTDPELGEFPDLERVCDLELGDDIYQR